MVPSWARLARVMAPRFRTTSWPAPGFSVMVLEPPLPRVKLATLWLVAGTVVAVEDRGCCRACRGRKRRGVLVVLLVV